MTQSYRPTEKLLVIIRLALACDFITPPDVMKLLECSYKHSCRLLRHLYDMRYEIPYLIIDGDCDTCKKIKISVKLNEDWI